jgi:hypothetical protein
MAGWRHLLNIRRLSLRRIFLGGILALCCTVVLTKVEPLLFPTDIVARLYHGQDEAQRSLNALTPFVLFERFTKEFGTVPLSIGAASVASGPTTPTPTMLDEASYPWRLLYYAVIDGTDRSPVSIAFTSLELLLGVFCALMAVGFMPQSIWKLYYIAIPIISLFPLLALLFASLFAIPIWWLIEALIWSIGPIAGALFFLSTLGLTLSVMIGTFIESIIHEAVDIPPH